MNCAPSTAHSTPRQITCFSRSNRQSAVFLCKWFWVDCLHCAYTDFHLPHKVTRQKRCNLLIIWCPEPESNRYAGFTLATDFKSVHTVSVDAAFERLLAFLSQPCHSAPGNELKNGGWKWQRFGDEVMVSCKLKFERLGIRSLVRLFRPETSRLDGRSR